MTKRVNMKKLLTGALISLMIFFMISGLNLARLTPVNRPVQMQGVNSSRPMLFSSEVQAEEDVEMGDEIPPAGEIVLDTSIVSLVIRSGELIVAEDMYFELLDYGDYVLLPLGLLASRLGYVLEYQRDREIVLVEDLEKGKTAVVDFKKNIYPEHPEWSDHPPVMHNGDFYVTTLLLEDLLGAEIEWNFRRQELLISLDGEKEVKDPEDAGQDADLLPDIQLKVPEVEGRDFSLGSIHYRVITEYRQISPEDSRAVVKEKLGLHGRIKDWAVSIGEQAEYNIITGEKEVSLPLIRARYVKNDWLLLLGDSGINLAETLGKGNIRGILSSYPEKRLGKIIALTSVSGEAAGGGEVVLYLNGQYAARQVVSPGGSYKFTHVPLVINKTNTIKVVLKKENEEEVVLSKRVAASTRILEEGTREYLLALGLYKGNEEEDWSRTIAAADMSYALSRNAALTWQLTAGLPRGTVSLNEMETASVLGIALRGEQLPVVFTLDWLAGGSEKEIARGGKTSLLYTFDSGFLEGAYFYIPTALTASIKEPAGRRLRGVFGWDYKDFTVRLQGDTAQSIQDKNDKEKCAEISIKYRNNQDQETTLKGKIGENRDSRFIPDQGQITKVVREGELALENRITKGSTEFRGQIRLGAAEITAGQTPPYRLDSLGLKSELLHRINESLLLDGSLQLGGEWWNEITERDAEAGIRVKWAAGKDLYLTGRGSLLGSSRSTLADIKLLESSTGAGMEKYLSENTSLYLDGSVNRLFYHDDWYATLSFGVDHFWDKKSGRVYLNLDYISPLGAREEPQWQGKLAVSRYLPNNLGLGIKVERSYYSIYDLTPEYLVSFSVDNILGFAGGTVLGQRYRDDYEHRAYVGGVVYLDLNNNGEMDEGEPPVPGIRMSLDGRRAVTDERGIYIFEYIRPGIYEVGFDLNKLDADYTVVTDKKVIRIRENENIALDFGLTVYGSISGIIFLDRDGDGIKGDDDDELSWIGVQLDQSGQKAFSADNGEFYLENVPLGEYTISVLEESLPSGMQVAEGFKVSEEVHLSRAKPDIEGIEIPLVYED